MHEHRIQHGVEQAADQESDDRPVHTNILQVAADPKLQPVDDGLGIPVGDHLADELGDADLGAGQQRADNALGRGCSLARAAGIGLQNGAEVAQRAST